jgi:hypothetical protein
VRFHYCIESVVNGKKYLVGNVGGATLKYGLVPPSDSRVLKFSNPSVCHLALQGVRMEYRGNICRMVSIPDNVTVKDLAAVDFPDKPKPTRYEIWDGRLNRNTPLYQCATREEAYKWILRGLRGTEGAERDHYVSLLLQLEDGKWKLYYDLEA